MIADALLSAIQTLYSACNVFIASHAILYLFYFDIYKRKQKFLKQMIIMQYVVDNRSHTISRPVIDSNTILLLLFSCQANLFYSSHIHAIS